MKGVLETSTVAFSLNNCLVKRSSKEWKQWPKYDHSTAKYIACWIDSSAAPTIIDFLIRIAWKFVWLMPFSWVPWLADLIISTILSSFQSVLFARACSIFQQFVWALIFHTWKRCEPNHGNHRYWLLHTVKEALIHPHVQGSVFL